MKGEPPEPPEVCFVLRSCHDRFTFYQLVPLRLLRDDQHVIPLVGKFLHYIGVVSSLLFFIYLQSSSITLYIFVQSVRATVVHVFEFSHVD